MNVDKCIIYYIKLLININIYSFRDSGSYYTEKAKIETVEKMKTIGEIDYYLDDEESKLNNQLRTASHIGNNLVKSADEFNETTKSEINKKYIYSNFYREHKSNLPDRKIF